MALRCGEFKKEVLQSIEQRKKKNFFIYNLSGVLLKIKTLKFACVWKRRMTIFFWTKGSPLPKMVPHQRIFPKKLH